MGQYRIASDSFVRADESPLSDSGGWGFWGNSDHLNLISNTARAAVVNNSCGMVWTGNAFPNDQWSQVQISAFNSTFGMGPMVRATAAGNASGYAFAATPTNIYLSRIDNLSSTNLATKAVTVNNGDILLMTAVGSVFTVYINGTLELTATDATYASGHPGITIYDSSAGLTAALNNWSGGGFSMGNYVSGYRDFVNKRGVDDTPPKYW